MRKHAYTFAAITACALVFASAGVVLAQPAPPPPVVPTPPPPGGYYDPAQQPRQPSPGDPDGLLTELFSDPSAGQPAGGTPQDGSGVLSLPGVPSPVTTPAGPGEAVVERQQQAAAGDGQPPVAAPVRRTGRVSRKPEWPTSQWVNNVYAGSEKAWRESQIPPGCTSLLYSRPLYHISCVNKPRRIGDPLPPNQERPSVYYFWP
ncbi:MAG: hypothetical protein LBR80_01150 [Deltaproteobacteria bacterium]|nr:hypothetical protein [Deltaproteobacteria bacterium]